MRKENRSDAVSALDSLASHNTARNNRILGTPDIALRIKTRAESVFNRRLVILVFVFTADGWCAEKRLGNAPDSSNAGYTRALRRIIRKRRAMRE